MQKTCLVALTFLCFLASACSPAVTEPPVPLAAVSPAAPTLTLSPTPTATPQSTRTPAPPTITPLPTIPTFTPTFDVRTIVTATPAPKAECPKENPSARMNFFIPGNPDDVFNPNAINDEKVLSHLNSGGSLSTLVAALQTSSLKKRFIYQYLTGDQENDLLIAYFNGLGYIEIHIYSCVDGSYQSFLPFGADWNPLEHTANILMVKDLNKNGILEVVLYDAPALFIIEWSGAEFMPVMLLGTHTASRPPEIKDIDHDGFDEIIFTGKEVHYTGFNEDVYQGAPWRDEIVVFSWDGSEYLEHPSEYSAPEYRFQAVQDADRDVTQGKYAQALMTYQNIIFSDKLKVWSPEMHAYELGILDANIHNSPTPTLPASDPAEYHRLAAYAYYRMVILHTHLGEMDATQIQYTTLQEKFPAGSPGHPYVEMATVFWETYQSSQNMTNACGAAIQYAAEHPEILTVLGSAYHGWQSHTYLPADICPFR